MLERADTGMRLINVRKDYGKVAVIHGVDLQIDEGDFVVFVGPSGCGKSTLLRMIAGLEEVTDGSIEIGGVDVTDVDPSRRGIAMVFQSYALYPHMSVRDNLGFGLSMANVPKDEIARNVAEAARILKLDALLDRRPGQLSGGQRQRVAIGRAIVRKPKVFLFDEPLSNLDAELRVTMRIEIARLHRELGNTMVYVTHDQTEAMTLADKIVVLRDGRIEQVGTPRQVYEDPANTFVAGFIGSPRMNLLKASTNGQRLRVGQDEIALASPIEVEQDEVVVGLRPEHLTIAKKGPTTIGATIDFSEYLGGVQYLYCQLDDGQSIVAEQREGNVVTPGTRVNFSWKPEKLRLFSSTGERIRA